MVTRTDGRLSRHSFSFGAHYDADNVGFGVLLANNDDLIQPGHGYSEHRHRDLEILSWVVSGTLIHQDSQGNSGSIRPGGLQHTTAGSGILHAEGNAAGVVPLRFVQMWVAPDTLATTPSYQVIDATDLLSRPALVPIASGLSRHRESAIRIGQAGAGFSVARLPTGATVNLPDAERVHLFVVNGSVHVEGVSELADGDALRLTGEGGRLVTASSAAEILVWELDRAEP